MLSASKGKCSLVQTQFSPVSSSRIASRYCIFLCPFVISYPRTKDHPTAASTVPILRRPSALLHSTMVSKVPWMGWLSWILQTLVVSNFMTSCLPHQGRVLCKREGFFPHEMTNHCHGAICQGFFGGVSFATFAPSKYFHCVFCPMSWLAKLELRRFHRNLQSFPKKKVEAPNKKKTTKCRNPYDGMWQMWHYTRHIYLKIRERKGPQVWTLRPDPACNRQADFLHSLTKGLNTRNSTGNIKCR